MAAPAPETDKKKAAALAKPGSAIAAGPEVAKDKADLGAMLRPEPKAAGGKLEVGGKNEAAEKEADKVADAMLKTPPASRPATDDKDKAEGEEPSARTNQPRAPPVLTIVSDTTIRRTTAQGGQPHLDDLSQTPALPGSMAEVSVSANEDSELDELTDGDFRILSEGESLQPKFLLGMGGAGRFAVGDDTARRIRSARGGAPLPGALRARIEGHLDVDLSAIRLQTGPEAQELCVRLGARAFAHGRNIWLGTPGATSDARLLTHEVVHTVQQGAAPRRPPPDRRRTACRPLTGGQTPRAPPTAPGTHGAPVRRFFGAIEDAIKRGAEGVADRTDSYGVLKVLIGRRLFTGETVNASPTDFVGAFMTFIGAEDTFEQMKQSGSLQKGFDEIRGGLRTYDISWDRVQRVFSRAEDEFEWTSPIDSLLRIFGPFFSDVLRYGVHVLRIVAELVAEAFVIGFGPKGAEVWERIKSIGDTIGLIIEDPLGFAMNLIRAVSQGINGFGERIWDHIKAGLLAWVLGPLQQVGVQLPAQLDLKGIVSVILQVLGLTYPQLRPRIVRALQPNGEIKVSVVERVIEVVNILRNEGLAGIWRKLMDYVQNLQTTVINGVRDWVVRAVVQAGIRKLVAWSNPAGALIDILLTIYNLIVFFVQKFEEILDFATSIFDSIGKIARGELSDAARAVEDSMAKTIPIIISFLVGFLGLPDIGGTIRNIITQIRARVHAAFDRVLDWIVDKVKKLIAKLVSKFRRNTEPERRGFVMDGEPHEMWVADEDGHLTVMMASGVPGPVPEDAAETTAEEHALSADNAFADETAAIEGLAEPEHMLHEKVDRFDRMTPPNSSAPSAREEMDAAVDTLTPKLSAAAERPANAADIDEDNADVGAAPESGMAALDRTCYPMRRRIRTTTAIEGAAGNWTAATALWEQAKTEAPSPVDIYANLARDHIPEFALLARVSRMAKPGLTRTGRPSMARLFPNLFNAVRNVDTSAKSSSADLPVIVIRTAINSQVGANSALLAEWSGAFRQRGEMWIATEYEAELDDEGRSTATEDLQSTYGAEALVTDMQTHIDEVKAKYGALPAQTMDDDFLDHLDRASIPVLQQITRRFFGGAAAEPPSTEGAGGGINLPYDDVLAEGELQSGSYQEISGGFELGDSMQRHHLVEQNISRKLRDRAKDLMVASLLGDTAAGLAEGALSAAQAGLSAEQKAALAGDPALAAQRDAAAGAVSLAFGDVPVTTGMNTTQGPDSQGFAIMVLSSVNPQAASQPDTNVDTAVAQAEAAFRTANAAALRTEIAASVASRQASMDQGLQDEWKAALRTLTGTAAATFRTLQQTSINEIHATADQSIIDRSEGMRGRFGTLTEDAIVSKNLET